MQQERQTGIAGAFDVDLAVSDENSVFPAAPNAIQRVLKRGGVRFCRAAIVDAGQDGKFVGNARQAEQLVRVSRLLVGANGQGLSAHLAAGNEFTHAVVYAYRHPATALRRIISHTHIVCLAERQDSLLVSRFLVIAREHGRR